jgi:apolipoprotein N-acyltransferase
MLALSQPPFSIWPLAAVALAPLLVVLRGRRLGAAVLLGSLAWASWAAISAMPWLYRVLRLYLDVTPVVALILGGGIAALYTLPAWIVFAALCPRLLGLGGITAAASIPALWALLEVVRSELVGAVPWMLLAHAVADRLRLVQVAGLFGVPAISFVLVSINLAVAGVVLRDRAAPAVAVLCLAASLAYGEWSLRATARDAAEHRVVLVQGDLSRRSESRPRRVIGRYLTLSRRAALDGVDLLVWPENAVPLYLQEQPAVARKLVRFLRHHHIRALLVGGPRHAGARPMRFFDSAFTLEAHGEVTVVHDKRWLVPGAETSIPGVPIARPFTPGDEASVSASPVGPIGVLLCYEAIFPLAARELVRAGAESLFNLSNDVWLGPAESQLVAMSRLRAVETRRDLLRVANQGTSFALAASGQTLAERPRSDGGGVLEVGLTRHRGRSLAVAQPTLGSILWFLILSYAALRLRIARRPPDANARSHVNRSRHQT